MEHVLFTGVVWPRALQITIPLTINGLLGGKNYDLIIEQGVFSLKLEVESSEKSYIDNIYAEAFTLVRTFVDLESFRYGFGLTTLFETIQLPGKNPQPLGNTSEGYGKLCTIFDGITTEDELLERYDKVCALFGADVNVSHALHDLAVVLTVPRESAINCARAIESIRRSISPIGMNNSKSWELMRSHLNIGKDYLTFITKLSEMPRHGDRSAPIARSDRHKAEVRAWTIMDRFFQYKLRDDKPLPIADFPILNDDIED